MHFFVERDRSPLDNHAGAQQLPALVQRQVRPVNHDQPLSEVFQPLAREAAVQIPAYPVQGRIPEQPIDALQAMFERDVTAEAQSDGRKAGAASAQQGRCGAP
jgi:hypothetical protein